MDDSAAGAAYPSKLLGPRRAFPPPAACIQNRSGGTGTPKAATARPIAYRYVISPPLRSAFFDHLAECSLDLRERRLERRSAGIDHDIPLRSDFHAMQPERLPNAPLDPVANDRSADGARYRKAQASCCSGRVRVCQAKGREQGTREADTVIIDGSKFGRAQNPRCVRKLQRAAGGGFSCWP